MCIRMLTLREFEEEDRYVFHGSGLKLVRLEPRISNNLIDGEFVDEDSAVWASQFLDYAIFMALINAQTCPAGARSGVSYEDGKLYFSATASTLEQLSDKTLGYVHVLHRSDFTARNYSEWMSVKPVTPVEIFEVTQRDFTHDISLIVE